MARNTDNKAARGECGGAAGELRHELQPFIGQQVVLDTAEPLVYIGTLTAVSESGVWLEHADLHDCRDGHSTKEAYVYETKTGGVRTNRRRIFVMRSAILSMSALSDVVHEDLADS